MVEVTEYVKEIGITQEVFQRWQEEDDPEDEPGPFLMPSDIRILAQRRAESEARAANGKRNGSGHSGTETVADAVALAEEAAPR